MLFYEEEKIYLHLNHKKESTSGLMGLSEHEEDRLVLQDALIESESSPYTEDGSVDIKGQPALKRNTGNWKTCPFIFGNQCCERSAYYGISINLVSYLTTNLNQGNASAARNVTMWQGTCFITPLIGAVLADSYWGRYYTVAAFCVIYFIGMCTLTLSAFIQSTSPCQYAFFFTGLYLIALGTGGTQPCVISFGADQFDETDPKERVSKGSFFNWCYFTITVGILISSTYIVWIQQNKGWVLGFGIPTLFLCVSIFSFVLGTNLYRFQKPGGSPVTRICQVLVASFYKRNLPLPIDSSILFETPSTTDGSRKIMHTDELKYFDKAGVVSSSEENRHSNPWRLCSVTQIEEAKILIRMFPIWATGIMFYAVFAQVSTMFVEQGMVMDTSIGSFTIPAASLIVFDIVSVLLWVPVYDRIVVPIARKLTGHAKGMSELQRMGIGLFLSVLCMSAATLVEIKRLDLAKSLNQDVAVSMNVFWQAPQYVFLGAAEVFYVIGQIDFFYNQSPDGMRSLCSALTFLTNAFGNYLSSFILTVVTYFSARGGKPGWIPNNLNEGHLDYFFCLLTGLSFLNLIVYIMCAKVYKSKAVSS